MTPAMVRDELLRRMFAARGAAGLWLASAAALALSWACCGASRADGCRGALATFG